MFVLGLKSRLPLPQQIAVIEMEGAIGPRLKAAEYVKLFRSLEENDHVKAVVLDIDSPGGSATGSNYLYLGVQALAKKKPVVAFIRGLGASGAYLFSCPAARIVAIPSAIIGSIGVISMRPLVYEALDRIGMRMTVTKSDRLKDMGSMFREPTDEEKPVASLVSNDLVEIYSDLQDGLELLSQDAVIDAIWDWRFSFSTHWGRHAFDSLRAVHYLVTDRMP